MRHTIAMLLLVTYCSYIITNNVIASDEQAYQYCITKKNSYIAIVWPLVQGMDNEIDAIFKKFGDIKYKKIHYFTFPQAYYLLRQAHPHIENMKKHVEWYFPRGTFTQPARIFVFECNNHADVILCKYAIRKLFNLQYRPVHINDNHDETIKLAQFFFKKIN